MSLGVGRKVLYEALQELRLRWGTIRSDWDDPAADHFERTYLDPLEHRIRDTASAIDQMREIVGRARRECE